VPITGLLLFLYLGPSPHFGTTMQTTFSPLRYLDPPPPLPSCSVASMQNAKIRWERSRERLSQIFWRTEKAEKTNKKTKKICKTYASAPLNGDGCVKNRAVFVGVEGLIKARTKWWHKEVQETAAAGVESCFVTGKEYFLPENWNACDHKKYHKYCPVQNDTWWAPAA